jgi:hypothetical protein
MRLPNSVHTSRPWRIHELTCDFRLEDVWELPGVGGPDAFPLLVQLIASGDPSQSSSVAVRTLFAIRWKIGELLGWDGPDAGLSSRVPTLRDRLPPDLRTPHQVRTSTHSPSPHCTCSRTSGRQRSPTGPCMG